MKRWQGAGILMRMGRFIARLIPGAALAVGAAAVTTITLRTLARWREELRWAKAWAAYRQHKS